ncbi:hypothetical protein T440DRAFT_476978 [Plenodomus tracheiphilus IPT5]|uniref:Mediator of RNA polymerase II transcription subunit 1 n=1 Tax=Plenodomus tracheiphilus IPT5 TaxID=1408161 RepID=A0A6A7BCQ5_9PLEO|nr:hypothetical protein T440DRAFT_476978 [Plenodomus tracheiphilus IPT5]
MATPTPSTNTPSKHLPTFSSPAPRSVPHTGTTNMLSYDSPAVLNMLNDASSGMGGVGMGITMSGLGMSSLGISASSMGRADEAERSRRLQSILHTVAAKPGRVSETGLLALCKSMGIACERAPDDPGTWSLLIGDEILCDVTFKNDEIHNVNLQTGLDETKPELHFGATGSQILLKSLRPLPGRSPVNNTLGRFSESLGKLNALTVLGTDHSGGVSCYNAIAGVYTSLRKLFEHEKKIELAAREPDERYRIHKAEREVLCKKSGRPRMNGGSCLGLSLEYWMDRRHLIPKDASIQSEKGKEKAGHELSGPAQSSVSDNEGLYSLTIECESCQSTLYTPIRVSEEWISDHIEKAVDANDANASIDNILLDRPSIDWLDPKPTYLEASTQGDDAMNIDSAGRLPNIRFVAKFSPPLVVPLPVYYQLYQIVGIEPRTEDYKLTTFVGLALRPGEEDPGSMATTGESTHEIRSSRSVLYIDENGQEKRRQHEMSLYVPKMEYSRTLESLPFSHPKQLVEILPILRQYAATTSLMRDAFFEPKRSAAKHAQPVTPPLTPPPETTRQLEEDRLQLDVNLSYTTPPRFTLLIPHANAITTMSSTPSTTNISALLSSLLSSPSLHHCPLSITIDIHPNAEFTVSDQNLIIVPRLSTSKSTIGGARDAEEGKEQDADVDMEDVERVEGRVKRLAKGLEMQQNGLISGGANSDLDSVVLLCMCVKHLGFQMFGASNESSDGLNTQQVIATHCD